MEITEQQLQDKITAMMPIEKKNFFISVALLNPKIKLLKSDNQISIASTIKIKAITGYEGMGKLNIIGSIVYKRKQAAFYFTNPVIKTMEIEQVPKGRTE